MTHPSVPPKMFLISIRQKINTRNHLKRLPPTQDLNIQIQALNSEITDKAALSKINERTAILKLSMHTLDTNVS